MGLFNFNKWPVRAVIISVRAHGGYDVQVDRIKKIKLKTGEEEWRRRVGHELLPPILYKYLSNNNTVFLMRDKDGNFGRARVDFGEGKIKGITTDIANWTVSSKEKARKLYENPSFFAKYGNFIMATSILITIGIMIYISLDKIIDLNQIGANALVHVKTLLESGCSATA